MSAQGLIRGIVLAGAGAAMVWGAHSAPVDTATGQRLAATTSPVEAASLVCPGGSADAGAVGLSVTSAPSSLATMLRTGGSATLRHGSSDAFQPFDLTRGGSTSTRLTDGPAVLEATGPLAPGLAAAQFASGGDKSTIAARTCAPSLNEAWIPVGTKGSSRLTTLVLVNSGSHAATVDVDVTSRDGDVRAATISDRSVPARSRVEVNLASDIGQHEGTVVHVRSEGGSVQTSVRDSARSGDTRGEEITAQYTAASTTQVIPAAPVTDGKTTVRLVAPSGRDAVVRLQALATTSSTSKDRVVTVPRGRSLDVTLDGLSGQTTAVRAVSESEIVAAAHAPAASGGSADFAWAQAAPDIADAGGASLRGAGAPGDLVLATTRDAARATVVVTTKDGKTTTHRVRVPKSGATRVQVPQDASVWVGATTTAGESQVHAAIVVRTGTSSTDRMTTLTLVPAPWLREQTVLVAR